MSAGFVLDPRLAADTVPVAVLDLCEVRLTDDVNYPWLVLVPRVAGAVEIVDLPRETQRRLMDETARASAALRAVTGCDKLNVAALGNQVAQLHVHIIARFRTDSAWPGPVWGKVPRRDYEANERAALVARVAAALA